MKHLGNDSGAGSVTILSVNSGKKSEQSFFYFTIYFLLQFSSNVGANNNSSVNFHCCFFVDLDMYRG